jgi:hypothetical protein
MKYFSKNVKSIILVENRHDGYKGKSEEHRKYLMLGMDRFQIGGYWMYLMMYLREFKCGERR